MKKIKILHKRLECIGCGLCAEVAPSYWYMDNDGLASFLNKRADDGLYETAMGWEVDIKSLKQAEEGCPVQIIKVKN